MYSVRLWFCPCWSLGLLFQLVGDRLARLGIFGWTAPLASRHSSIYARRFLLDYKFSIYSFFIIKTLTESKIWIPFFDKSTQFWTEFARVQLWWLFIDDLRCLLQITKLRIGMMSSGHFDLFVHYCYYYYYYYYYMINV